MKYTQSQDIEVLKRALTDTIYEASARNNFFCGKLSQAEMDKILSTGIFDPYVKDGRINPQRAETMIGMPRLNNFQDCIEAVIKERIMGDILEAGVFRGGACILAAGVLQQKNSQKNIYLADSFEGLPKPEAQYKADKNDNHHTLEFLKVSQQQVEANFSKYGLLSDRVKFIPGFFKESLKAVPFKKLAVLRLDADMYSSTWQVLSELYKKVSIGGYVIVDDYLSLPSCRAAVTDFRRQEKITDELITVDWAAVYWKKTK